MNKKKIENIKKKLVFRCTYTGTKETDLLFKKKIIDKLDFLSSKDIIVLSELFLNYSDNYLLEILLEKRQPENKFENIFKKILK